MNSLQCHREPPYLKVICDIDNYVLKNGAVHFFAMEKFQINPILANVPILYPLKRPENLWFSSVFREYKMGTLARNGLSYPYSLNKT